MSGSSSFKALAVGKVAPSFGLRVADAHRDRCKGSCDFLRLCTVLGAPDQSGVPRLRPRQRERKGRRDSGLGTRSPGPWSL